MAIVSSCIFLPGKNILNFFHLFTLQHSCRKFPTFAVKKCAARPILIFRYSHFSQSLFKRTNILSVLSKLAYLKTAIWIAKSTVRVPFQTWKPKNFINRGFWDQAITSMPLQFGQHWAGHQESLWGTWFGKMAKYFKSINKINGPITLLPLIWTGMMFYGYSSIHFFMAYYLLKQRLIFFINQPSEDTGMQSRWPKSLQNGDKASGPARWKSVPP